MIFQPTLEFENKISGDSRVLVVNPQNTYWSYFLTAEAAARASEKSNHVTWVNISCRQSRKFEINLGDNLPLWRYRDTAKAVKGVFDKLNIQSEVSYTRLSKSIKIPVFQSIKELRDFQSDGINIGALIFSGIASAKKSTAFSLEEAKPYINHYFRYASGCIERLREKIVDYNPDLIVTTNDRLIGSSAALSLAQEYGIPSRVVYWGSNPNRIQDYIHSLYDSDEWQLKIEEFWQNFPPTMEQSDLIVEEICRLQKGPNQDSLNYLKSQKSGKTLHMSAKTAIFYAQSEHEHSPNFINPDNRRFRSQYEAFMELQRITNLHGWKLILKYHPLRFTSDQRQHLSVQGLDWAEIPKMSHVTEIPANSDLDTYQLIMDSALNIVWSSTVGLESISRERPTLVLGNPHWLSRKWGIHAWNEKELDKFFSQELKYVPKTSLIPWFWYLRNFGSDAKFFNLVNSTFTFNGKKLVKERFLPSTAVRIFRFLVNFRVRIKS
jgi:hypothetical protein